MRDAWPILRCPACGRAPGPVAGACASCGRPVRGAGGGFDLLTDEERAAAAAFGAAYSDLRRREGWAGPDGVEDPAQGPDRLWTPRRKAAAEVARWVKGGIVLDVGSGGGWLAELIPGAAVVAIDLLEPPEGGAAQLRVRGDMRRLPVAGASADACVYCASLHHAPLEAAVAEAARALREGGRLVVLESPLYRDARGAAAARERSRSYYRAAGVPELADAYHPIVQDHLQSALASADFTVELLERARGLRLPGRPPRFAFLAARRNGRVGGGAEQDQ